METPGPSAGAAAVLFTVFEVTNDRRREVYVGLTELPMFQATELFRASPPSCLAHWRPEDPYMVRSVEFDLTHEDARRFIANYVKTPLPAGWRYVVTGG